jgi:hypothetical protein
MRAATWRATAMRVFVSWSGDLSHEVAKALKDWLEVVIQDVDVFLSSTDIEKGTQWFTKLSEVLEESDFGILCLTPENLSAPWILYEAGAVSKRFAGAHVTPLLIGVKTKDLSGPLAQFNATGLDRDELSKLCAAINDRLGDEKLSESKLGKAFDTAWPSLEKAMKTAVESHPVERKFQHDVFLSTPMAVFADDAEYKAAHSEFKKVFNALSNDCDFSVYWAAAKIESVSDFDTVDVSAIDDLNAIRSSRYFVLLYQAALGALFEPVRSH